MLALEMGDANNNLEDKGALTLDDPPEDNGLVKTGPLSKVSNILFSWTYIYLLVIFVCLLVAGNITLIIFFTLAND
jgi:hypothetical protein